MIVVRKTTGQYPELEIANYSDLNLAGHFNDRPIHFAKWDFLRIACLIIH